MKKSIQNLKLNKTTISSFTVKGGADTEPSQTDFVKCFTHQMYGCDQSKLNSCLSVNIDCETVYCPITVNGNQCNDNTGDPVVR
jgi:hypothetical protein